MVTDPNNNFVLAELEPNNSSHIYLLNQTLKNCIDDFVEGFNVWEKSKAEIINKMAITLEKLHFLGEYTDPLNTISSYIIRLLRDRGVSEGQAHYVTIVLPSKYKNPDLARDQTNNNHYNNNGVNFNADSSEENQQGQEQQQQQQVKPVNIYHLKKILENLSQTELQNYALELEQKHKHMRNNMKAEKDVLEYLAIKNKIPLPRYKKESADIPPEHLHGWTLLLDRTKKISQRFLNIHKYLEDVAKSIEQFPPEKEVSERNAKRMEIFENGVLKTIEEILLAPHTDKKWSADWIKWIDIHFTRLEQSKNYAGSKHALETGEYAWKSKDGQEFLFKLDRGITREQVGDKEPELFEMVQQMLIANPMLMALHDWSYSTFIDEEYDADGKPIIVTTRKEKKEDMHSRQ